MSSHELTRGVVHQLLIDDVIPDPTQPRQTFLAKPLEELAESIKSRGVLQPITVVQSGAQFIIKMGERRWRAAKLAGLETIPALIDIVGGDAGDLAIDQLAENDLREGLNPIERATTFQRIKDEQGLSVKALAELLERHGMKMSRPAVSNTMRLLKLPEKARDLVAAGTLKESYARLLLPYVDHPKIVESVVDDIVSEKYEYIDAEWINETISVAVESVGLCIQDDDGCENCACRVNTKGWQGEVAFCVDPDNLKAKRKAAAEKPVPKEPAAPPKTPETDPTKVTPKKVNRNKDGVVSLARRRDRIRELIDDLLQPVLIETCATEPVSQVLALPLLAYAAANFPADERPVPDDTFGYGMAYPRTAHPSRWGGDGRSTEDSMNQLPITLGRGTLTAFLEPELACNDCSAIVEAVIMALDIEQRRKLAQYMSIDIASFWKNSEEYAKLFTKPEIIALIGDKFDPPDVPAGEWRSRLADQPGVPDLVREVWNSPIDNILRSKDVEDDDERAAA